MSTCYLLTLSNRLFPFLVAFRMYDLDGDGLISRDELLAVLHMMVGANISEDQVCLSLSLFIYYFTCIHVTYLRLCLELLE